MDSERLLQSTSSNNSALNGFSGTIFTVYRKRWFMLAVLTLLNFSNGMVSQEFTEMKNDFKIKPGELTCQVTCQVGSPLSWRYWQRTPCDMTNKLGHYSLSIIWFIKLIFIFPLNVFTLSYFFLCVIDLILINCVILTHSFWFSFDYVYTCICKFRNIRNLQGNLEIFKRNCPFKL